MLITTSLERKSQSQINFKMISIETKKRQETQAVKRAYLKPSITSIKIDHEISLVMMSESGDPPPEFISTITKKTLSL